MAKFAIADAANRAGVERTTLYRELNKGEISAEIDAHGNKVSDASELMRVYLNVEVLDGPATVAPPLSPVEKLQTATGEATRGLLREVEIRDERIEDMKRRIEALDRSERDRLLKVIEEQSSSVKLLTEGVKAKEKNRQTLLAIRSAALRLACCSMLKRAKEGSGTCCFWVVRYLSVP